MLAYLVIREGTKWTDVFRLIPGQSVTIGRAPTNQIILKDDRCSRTHAEVFTSQGKWMICAISIAAMERSSPTNWSAATGFSKPGDIVRIGQSQLAFVHDLAKAFPDSSHIPRLADLPAGDGRRHCGQLCRRQRVGSRRADHDHASPRPDQVSRPRRHRGRRDSQSGAGRGAALPPGVRAGKSAGREHHCVARIERTVRRDASRHGRRAVGAARIAWSAHGEGSGGCRIAK